MTTREIANRERDSYADYLDRRQAAHDEYAAKVAAADAWWAGVIDELNNLRRDGLGTERVTQ